MTMINRLIDIATEAVARRREHNDLTRVLRGPDSAFRSELIEVLSAQGIDRLI